jgi:hypothetical protein
MGVEEYSRLCPKGATEARIAIATRLLASTAEEQAQQDATGRQLGPLHPIQHAVLDLIRALVIASEHP